MSADAFAAVLGARRGSGRAQVEHAAAIERYGPNGWLVVRLIEQVDHMDDAQREALFQGSHTWVDNDEYWDLLQTLDTAISQRPNACLEAERDTIWVTVGGYDRTASLGEALAPVLVIRDLIADEVFRLLYQPWANVFGWPAG
jgi:hypothetical protein